MPLTAPNLDDRNYASIVAEAKTLIPRYAPEWTNFNESDPGITLMELFAWMTDMMIYRLNQVPERNYIKFLQLLGIELNPAQSARAEITFTLARDDVEYVIVPQETQVAVSDGGPNGPIIFETDESLIALGAKLKAVQSFDGFSYSNETNKNTAVGQWYYPFGSLATQGSALVLGFDSPLPFTDQQVDLAFIIYTNGLASEGTHCDIDISTMPVPVDLVWEYFDGKAWQALSLDKDETRALTRNGHVFFDGPGTDVKKAQIGAVKDKLYYFRCRLDQGSYEIAPRLVRVMTNTAPATQAITIRDEVLGGSDGTPNQVFRVRNTPIIVLDQPVDVNNADGTKAKVTSLRLEVDEGSGPGFVVWQQVDDFYASKPDDTHYVLNRTTGEVRFGDGTHGRIPVANAANPAANVVARQYRYGGGKIGNVGAGKINQMQSSVDGVSEATNLQASLGGSEEETVQDAKLRAPLELKSKDRAVTAEDFEFLAKQTPGVRIERAKALPLTHPRYPGVDIPGVVTVLVVPDSDAPNPLPSPVTLQLVCAHLNQHRLLTSELYVAPPTYHLVKIEAGIIVRPEADLAEVKHAVEQKLTQYFSPLTGGENGAGWDFGGAIYFSEVYRVVMQTPGVARIQDGQFFIWLDNARQDFCKDVTIGTGELVYSDGHDIKVSYSR